MNAGQVGVHLGAFVVGAAGPEDAAVAVHRFAAQVPGYPGWEWQAVVACAAGSSYVTVNEVSLVPSPSGTALRAPEWVPFAQRVRPGDLKPGMTLPPAVGDERLTENGEDSATRATDDERSAAAEVLSESARARRDRRPVGPGGARSGGRIRSPGRVVLRDMRVLSAARAAAGELRRVCQQVRRRRGGGARPIWLRGALGNPAGRRRSWPWVSAVRR